MDVSEVPSLQGLIRPSVVVERGGRKIGIIGYLTTDTPVITNYYYLQLLRVRFWLICPLRWACAVAFDYVQLLRVRFCLLIAASGPR
jgi:hypothetical protein